MEALKRVWSAVFPSPCAITEDERKSHNDLGKKLMQCGEIKNIKLLNDYGKQEYDRLYDVFNKLDEKANEIIKYLGGGTALASLASIVSIKPEQTALIYWLMPAFFMSIVSIGYAFWARRPIKNYPMPSSAYDNANIVIHFKDDAEKAIPFLVSMWSLCTIKAHHINECKGRLVANSYLCYLIAVAFLGLPLVAMAWGLYQPKVTTAPVLMAKDITTSPGSTAATPPGQQQP